MVARFNRRAITAANSLRTSFRDRSANPAALLSEVVASALRPYTKAERTLPIVVAAIVGISSLLVLLPSSPSAAVLGTQGGGGDVRIAVGGGSRYQTSVDGPQTAGDDVTPGDGPSFQPISLPGDVSGSTPSSAPTTAPDQVLADGTLVTGYAPATSVEDGSSLITTYRVRSGDTLSSVAKKYKINMMTLWWANKLKSKTDLHVGQILQVPTADGLIVTVTANDTLDSLAARYKVDPAEIVALNQLVDPVLVVGQVLIMPGAHGAPIPTPKPLPVAVVKYHPSSGGTASGIGTKYTGGRLRWPVMVAATTSASTSTASTLPSTSPPRWGHRLSPPPAVGLSLPAGRTTAAAGRSGSPTAPTSALATTTCPRSPLPSASTSRAASRLAGLV